MLKIQNPHLEMILSEPRPRRVDFLNLAIRELGLKNIEVFGHKMTSRSFSEPMDGVITRAFEVIPKTLPRLSGCLGMGGRVFFMKGPNVDAEMAEAKALDEYSLKNRWDYRLPHSTHDRVLVEYERVAIHPDRKLPHVAD
jgi:16S rRNA (guanine527-N7)-methyltransferase